MEKGGLIPRKKAATMAALVGVLMGMLSCGQPPKELPATGNAVYYWRTDFRLDSTERAFLRQYSIKRIYSRYFDVVTDAERGPLPNATITFTSEIPDSIEIIPTIFITEDCMHRSTDSLASRLVRRVVQMNETHDIAGVRELQIDCDYTARSRATYYHFLCEVADEAQKHGLRLSTTIRLHQLSMPAPPVDYGVLMLYNTGDMNRFTERSPILDMADVAPYLRHLKDYPLPLGAAYPVFLWQRNVYGVRLEHEADAQEILKAKRAVEHERPDLRRLILTYHLSSENIQRYQPNEYEEIYQH